MCSYPVDLEILPSPCRMTHPAGRWQDDRVMGATVLFTTDYADYHRLSLLIISYLISIRVNPRNLW